MRNHKARQLPAFRPLSMAGAACWVCLCGLLSGGSPVLAQKPLGVDVSKWQGDISVDEWKQAYNSGRTFAIIKATQGTVVTDEKFSANIVNARLGGLLVGCYHFADPLNQRQPAEPPHTAIDEANYFVSVAGAYMAPGYLPPVLDLEYGSSLGIDTISLWANQFCNRVLQLTGVRPMIYTNTNWAQNYLNSTVTVWDLWIANYGYTNPQTQSPPTGVWSTWKFWQYSSTGDVPGLGDPIDLDVFNGSMAQLQDYLIGDPGEIVVAPSSLSQTVRHGVIPSNQIFTVSIGGTTPLFYNLNEDPDSSWMSMSPTSGFSFGEADPITVSYTPNLPIGVYATQIIVNSTEAANSPQAIPVTLTIEPVPGDLDLDGDIDTADVVRFKTCMTAPLAEPGGTVSPSCDQVDYNKDGDVDQADFGILQRCLSGTSFAPDPYCPEN